MSQQTAFCPTPAMTDVEEAWSADDGGTASAQSDQQAVTHPIHIPGVLIIEDNPGDVELTMLAFQTRALVADFRVVVNGAKAIEFFQSVLAASVPWRPDLILLDLNLPKVNGREVLAFLKQHEDLRDIPTVVLTSSHSARDQGSCSELGADAYLIKPMTLQELLDMMKEIEPILGLT
jgi:two-component system, chemotaxis family, response regulator Rcp1